MLSLPCTRPSHTLLCVIPKLIHLHTFTACHCRESVEGLLDALMPNDMLRYHVGVETVYRMYVWMRGDAMCASSEDAWHLLAHKLGSVPWIFCTGSRI